MATKSEKANRVSPIWDCVQVDPENEKYIICNKCHKRISRGTDRGSYSTTPIAKHLGGCMPIEFANAKKIRSEAAKKKIEENTAMSVHTFFPSTAASTPRGKKRRLESETFSECSEANDIDLSNISELSGILETTLSLTKQPTITEGFGRKDKWPQNSMRAMDMDLDLVRMFALDKQPINSVNRLGLSGYLNKYHPKYNIPSYKYLAGNTLVKLYKASRSSVSGMLKELSFISFDTDIWSNTSKQQYISLIGHCTFNNFDQQCIMLNCYPFKDSHTGVNICDNLSHLIRDWEIPKYKVHNIVHDNAANMVSGIDSISDFTSLRCFIHTTQLIITDCILEQVSVSNVLEKCRKFNTYFKLSSGRTEAFLQLQRNDKVIFPLVVVFDNTTRWDSKHDMVERMLKLKKYVHVYTGDVDVGVNFFPNDWAIMAKVMKMLRCFKRITKQCSDRYSVCSAIIPEIIYIKHLLNTWSIGNEFKGCLSTIYSLQKSVNERYGPYLNNESCILATYLDPRYKL